MLTPETFDLRVLENCTFTLKNDFNRTVAKPLDGELVSVAKLITPRSAGFPACGLAGLSSPASILEMPHHLACWCLSGSQTRAAGKPPQPAG